MRIGAFVYNFPHWKSQQGLVNLSAAGLSPELVLAQDWIDLGMDTPAIPEAPEFDHVNETSAVANVLGLFYYVAPHESEDTIALIKAFKLDLGVILGARILPKKVIDAFRIGVLNLHPGYIPLNRGLENTKWAVIGEMKQAVTAHLIDERVDMGQILGVRDIDVFPNDSLREIRFRLMEMEQKMMVESIRTFGLLDPIPVVNPGRYNRPCTPADDSTFLAKFQNYKNNYPDMIELKGDDF